MSALDLEMGLLIIYDYTQTQSSSAEGVKLPTIYSIRMKTISHELCNTYSVPFFVLFLTRYSTTEPFLFMSKKGRCYLIEKS